MSTKNVEPREAGYLRQARRMRELERRVFTILLVVVSGLGLLYGWELLLARP